MTKAGRVAMVPKGAYVHGTQYTRLDTVTYEGCTYVAKRDNRNVHPTKGASNDDWMITIDESDIAEKVDWLDKRAIVHANEEVGANKWYKIASVHLDNSGIHRQISFKVNSSYAKSGNVVCLGILTAFFRSSSGSAIASLVWEYVNDAVDLNNFIILSRYDESTKYDAEIWCKVPIRYGGYIFEVLNEGLQNNHGDFWSVYDLSSSDGLDEPTPGYTQVPSTLMTLANRVSGPIGVRNYLKNVNNLTTVETRLIEWNYDESTEVYRLVSDGDTNQNGSQVHWFNVLSNLQYLKGKKITIHIDEIEVSELGLRPGICLSFSSVQGSDKTENRISYIEKYVLLKDSKKTENMTVQVVVPDSDSLVDTWFAIRQNWNNPGVTASKGATATFRGITITVGETAVDCTPNPEDFKPIAYSGKYEDLDMESFLGFCGTVFDKDNTAYQNMGADSLMLPLDTGILYKVVAKGTYPPTGEVEEAEMYVLLDGFAFPHSGTGTYQTKTAPHIQLSMSKNTLQITANVNGEYKVYMLENRNFPFIDGFVKAASGTYNGLYNRDIFTISGPGRYYIVIRGFTSDQNLEKYDTWVENTYELDLKSSKEYNMHDVFLSSPYITLEVSSISVGPNATIRAEGRLQGNIMTYKLGNCYHKA